MNEFDQFVKHKLKVKNYVRYTDDFIITDTNRKYLEILLLKIDDFLQYYLKLTLHPKKITIRKLHQGIDFLGYVAFPKHRLLRTKTKQRIFKKMRQRIQEYNNGEITKTTLNQSLQSYLGVLSHANSYALREKLKNYFWFES